MGEQLDVPKCNCETPLLHDGKCSNPYCDSNGLPPRAEGGGCAGGKPAGLQAALLYLAVLFGRADPEQFIVLSHKRGPNGGFLTQQYKVRDAADAAAFGIARAEAGDDVYVRVSPIDRILQGSERGKAEDTSALVAAHVDVDFADGNKVSYPPDEAAALAVLKKWGIPAPTIIVRSGHGLHLYWVFAEPMLPRAAARFMKRWKRTVLHRFAEAGLDAVQPDVSSEGEETDTTGYKLDRGAFDLARVLRLAGTTNYKGEPLPVELAECDPARLYDVDVLAGHLLDAVADEKPPSEEPASQRGAAAPPASPSTHEPPRAQVDSYLTSALEGEFRILAATPKGGRNNQLNNSAVKLAHWITGKWKLDQSRVEETLLAACQTNGLLAEDPRGTRATLRSGLTKGKSEPWDRPHGGWRKTSSSSASSSNGHASPPPVPAVRSDVPTLYRPPDLSSPIQWPVPMRMSEDFRDAHCIDADGRLVTRHHRDEFLSWENGAYRSEPTRQIKDRIYRHLDGRLVLDKDGKIVRFIASTRSVNELLNALPAVGLSIGDAIDSPAWLDGARGPDPREVVACTNGLLHVPTGQMHPPTPAFFTRSGLPVAYQANAPDPAGWLAFLRDALPNDPGSIATLQEIFGYLLVPDTRQEKIFLIVGPKRAGKGVVVRVLNGLIGEWNTCAPTLSSLGNNFGMQSLIGRQLATITDARLGHRADQAAIVERLLAISGEDSQTVARKHKTDWHGKLAIRFLIVSNELLRLADASGALASRFIVLKFTQSFYGREDHGLTDRLLGELPGILRWSIEGLRRLLDRGHFVQPASSADAIADLEALGSPVGAFVRERCVVAPGRTVECGTLYSAWKRWCSSQGRDHPGTLTSFSRDLKSACQRVTTSNPRRTRNGRPRFFEGIDLLSA